RLRHTSAAGTIIPHGLHPVHMIKWRKFYSAKKPSKHITWNMIQNAQAVLNHWPMSVMTNSLYSDCFHPSIRSLKIKKKSKRALKKLPSMCQKKDCASARSADSLLRKKGTSL